MITKEIGLSINKKKKLIPSRQQHTTRKLELEGFSFERVKHFQYIRAWVNVNANSHEETKESLIMSSRCNFGLSSLFKS